MTIQNILLPALLYFAASSAFAAGKATVDVSAKVRSDKKVELTFKTTPAEGLAINSEGPWKLEIKNPGSIKFEKSEYKRSDWKDQIAGFLTSGTPGAQKSSTVEYKMVAFICTKDKTQCFREVIENSANVTW